MRRRMQAAAGSESKIQNLAEEYCDDFQCTSSPQVEQSIRAFARDVERCQNWTLAIFAEDVKYRGGPRSFTGKSNYRNNKFNQMYLDGYTTTITNMEMTSKSSVEITWQFQGKLGPLPVSGIVKSVLLLNVLTGRITEHCDNVKLSCSLPAQLVYSFRKFAWAQGQNAENIKDKVNNALDSLSVDDDDFKQSDPSDPTRFFQQKDNTFNDGVSYAIFLTILWALWQAYSNLDGF